MTATKRRSRRAAFGNVRQLPSGRYQARYTDARMDGHTAPHTFATRREADDWLATVRADMVRGTWRDPRRGSITFAEYAGGYLATRLDLAPRTRQTYDSVLATWLATPLELPETGGRRPRTVDLGSTELRALTLSTVRDWYAAALHTADKNAAQRAVAHDRSLQRAALHDARAWARDNGHDIKDTGRLPQAVLDAWHLAGSPAARLHDKLGRQAHAQQARRAVSPTNGAGRARVAQAYRLLHLILANAAREGRMDANPCQIPGAGTVKATERVPATPAQVNDLAAAMPPRLRAAVQLAAWSGLRSGELFGLARRHVDLDPGSGRGTVRVERAVVRLHGQPPHLGPTKTAASRRTVHLPPHVVRLLAEHLDAFTGSGADALVFASSQGGIVDRDVREAFWKARAAIGRPDLRWHDLRHTGATLAAQAGASLREIQHRLGHTTVAAAMIYQHHDHDRDRDLAARLATLVTPPTNAVPLRLHGGD